MSSENAWQHFRYIVKKKCLTCSKHIKSYPQSKKSRPHTIPHNPTYNHIKPTILTHYTHKNEVVHTRNKQVIHIITRVTHTILRHHPYMRNEKSLCTTLYKAFICPQFPFHLKKPLVTFKAQFAPKIITWLTTTGNRPGVQGYPRSRPYRLGVNRPFPRAAYPPQPTAFAVWKYRALYPV